MDKDVFDDKEEVKTEETLVETEAEVGGEEETVETPATDKDEEKMVPVHRMKAAVKNVTEERDSLKREVEKLKGNPPQEEDLSQILFNERTNLSRELMIETKTDYEDMEKLFAELVEQDETLAVKLRQSANPAKFAYNTAKNHLEVEDLKKLKESDDFAEFQKWKKAKAEEEKPEVTRKKAALSVPNLTRATESKPKDDDMKKDVFAGAHF